ncbi:putative CTS1 Endochitinase [Venustampulla echinocandica]|uniref:chitinase n=1 Tax=Venustampulla echinocandica TaxID=2656787 RepID=A0A370T8N6_9HELO|nr:putative CTS1 Endochitinase [Venustampulla echinocandica]RDL29787.1 putative CTS1 Endochitinase [Venustampulla echinocandica]
MTDRAKLGWPGQISAEIITLAFLTTIQNPSLNFASAGDLCTPISNSSLFYCSQLEADIKTCQQEHGKSIVLSIGGATYSEGGFSNASIATSAANNIWSIFGPIVPGRNVFRPFGSSVIDGFDFDFESNVQNMIPFANQLRSLMDADMVSTGKQWLLTAAPQCPYPDAADGPMLAGKVHFDAIWVQFYNNYCGVQSFIPGASTQNNFNFDTWNTWAKNVSLNPNVKVFLGIPGASGAGSGYTSGSKLASAISYCKGFPSFGGVMIWDMSQVWANSGFLDSVTEDLGGYTPSPSTTSFTSPATLTTKTTPPTITTSPPSTTSSPGLLGQWAQCGGQGYSGPIVCHPPYKCVALSVWWSQCE